MTIAINVITGTEVRASIRRVIDHAESIWDEWAWQVENQTWAAPPLRGPRREHQDPRGGGFMISQAEMHLLDADAALEQLAGNPEHPDRDHLAALATSSALTSIAASLAGGS